MIRVKRLKSDNPDVKIVVVEPAISPALTKGAQVLTRFIYIRKGHAMKISTRGRYALRLMLDLAICDTENPVSLKDIAKRQGISEKYMEQIISILNKAGYVRSIRGAQGGYFLKGKPEDYTVGMILRLTEGDLAPVECVSPSGFCDRQSECVTKRVWDRLYDAINDVVEGITLADLVKWNNEIMNQY